MNDFERRHIGPGDKERQEMLRVLGRESTEQLAADTIPARIRLKGELKLGAVLTEAQVLAELRDIADANKIFRSYIGLGYYDTLTPAVIQRNIIENPGWYTQYTPYQAEISQGRLEALLNFQTMVADLTAMEIANASLLDEGTAAAEAVTFAYRLAGGKRRRVQLAANCHPQTAAVVKTRAVPLGLEVEIVEKLSPDAETLAVLVQYPGTEGDVSDYRALAADAHQHGTLVIAAVDLLALALLTPPGEWGADAVIGSSQRFGVPLGFGGPHAAFFATREKFKRELPGRVIGVSKDAGGRIAYRLAIQTREQHIRREKATSNICTAQVLLGVVASMYAVYHGPAGIREIAGEVHRKARVLGATLRGLGLKLKHEKFFDTIAVELTSELADEFIARAAERQINLRKIDSRTVGISCDEASREEDLAEIASVFAGKRVSLAAGEPKEVLSGLLRSSTYLSHPVFNKYHSETEFLRYVKKLESRDLSLTNSMIPLGSCTMKLNAAVEMLPITWPEWNRLHPFAPAPQTRGYHQLITELEEMLAEITGMEAVSLQPNAGSQGEYAGLLAIREYHRAQGNRGRNLCLIPCSAHGTNPASAALAGFEVAQVACDPSGNVDVHNLKQKLDEYHDRVACLMITYPSTHGVFEEQIVEIGEAVHQAGALLYLDGANMNAQVGLCRPGDYGVDVCHLNLHKTFSIPHGGGGPGVGPIAVKSHLAPYLPGHPLEIDGLSRKEGAVSSAPWGSASVLPISWIYIKLMGGAGLRRASEAAILNANYIAARLHPYYPILYRGPKGFVAHECILDCRSFKRSIGIEAGDIAKRLMDYGFHAPTVSFPVVETLMVEPTESESKAELDRFCDAMIAIREEIKEVEEGRADRTNNLLKNAPHTAELVASDDWSFPYSRERAAYPVPSLREHKFWPAVRRIDSAYGDRNLFCVCPQLE